MNNLHKRSKYGPPEYKEVIGDKMPVLKGYMVYIPAIFPDRQTAEDVVGMINHSGIDASVVRIGTKKEKDN